MLDEVIEGTAATETSEIIRFGIDEDAVQDLMGQI